MAAYSKQEQERAQPRDYEYGGSSRRRQQDTWSHWQCASIALVVVLLVSALIWYICQVITPPDYTVVITGTSDLTKPVSDMKQGGVLLNPAFNLTVGITSTIRLYGACIDPKTVSKLSYSYEKLPLATGNVPSMCVGPLGSTDRHVVATGSNVPMPGFLIDTLAREIRSGEAMFNVHLLTYMQEESNPDWSWKYIMRRWVGIGDAVATNSVVGQLSEPTKNMLEQLPSFSVTTQESQREISDQSS